MCKFFVLSVNFLCFLFHFIKKIHFPDRFLLFIIPFSTLFHFELIADLSKLYFPFQKYSSISNFESNSPVSRLFHRRSNDRFLFYIVPFSTLFHFEFELLFLIDYCASLSFYQPFLINKILFSR